MNVLQATLHILLCLTRISYGQEQQFPISPRHFVHELHIGKDQDVNRACSQLQKLGWRVSESKVT